MSASQTERVLIKGNEAVAFGAVDAGCRCYFGYPITPQNEIPEALSVLLPENGGRFVQAESEVAASNMLLGAAACGVPAMTSSSGCGISLMQEAVSYMAGSHVPGVIVNMQRGGPGLGDIGPSQGDYFQAVKGGGHGDHRNLVLAPATAQECYDFMFRAFALAFKYANPVMVLGDAIVGQIKEPVRREPPRDAMRPEDIRALAKDLRISVITTKRAYDELEADGFLYTVAGKGCFVAEKNLDLIREQKLKELEDHLDAAVELAAGCGVSALELMEMLRILLKEEEPHV